MKLFKTMLGLLLAFCLFAALPGCGGGGSSSGGNVGNDGGDVNGDLTAYKYFIYITNDTKINIYTMDYAKWILSASAVEYSFSDIYPRAMAQHPSKPYLYVATASPEGKTVRVLSITPTTGELTEIQTINTGGYEEIEITPDGKFLYTSGQGWLTGYQVSEDGKLAKVDEKYSYPNHIKLAPDGKVLYATYNNQSGSSWVRYLQSYDVNPNGTLTSRANKNFEEPPYHIGVFDQFVYMTDYYKLYQYNGGAALNQNGIINTGYGALVATRGYLYATRGGNIYGFSINASTGSLTEFNGTGHPFPATSSPIRKLSVDPNGKYLYAVDADNKALLGYSIATSGELTKLNWNVTISGTPYSAVIVKVRL